VSFAVALPVFQEVMLRMYGDRLAGPVPSFPLQMEQRITQYLQGDVPAPVAGTTTSVTVTSAPPEHGSPGGTGIALECSAARSASIAATSACSPAPTMASEASLAAPARRSSWSR
jgi:hypothetical protein